LAAQTRVPRIGLYPSANQISPGLFQPFLQQMHDLGYAEGQSVHYERRFAAGQDDLVPKFAADLVRSGVNVIVVTGPRESIAATQATTTIPLVTIVNPDPVTLGQTQSLSHPGGNLTV